VAKKALTSAQIYSILKFNPDWIKDPVPLFERHLNRVTLQQIARAKREFGKQVNDIVKSAKVQG
jgi:hypothetical protein